MATTSSTITANRSTASVSLSAIFWIVFGIATLAPALGLWPGDYMSGRGLHQVTLLITGVAGLILAVTLFIRQPWARPAAVIFHLWLGGLLLLTALRPAANFETLIAALPSTLTAPTWLTFLRFVFVVAGGVSLAMAYLLEQPNAWDAFSSGRTVRQRGSLCPTCGSTQHLDHDGQPYCSYCGATMRHIYFLQPVLRNARRVLLLFEPGHERIRIGRSVGNGEAWVDASENKRYRTISRHHADIEIDFKTGQLTLHKAFTSQEVFVDNEPVLMSAPVQLGSLIQLGKVQFILGNSEYEPTLAYFVDQMDEEKRHLLRFNGLENEQTLGRSRDCDVVLNYPDISHLHATVLFDVGSQMFFIRNESERSPVYIDGHLLEPSRTTNLSSDELIIVQLGAHNFNFLPVLYQPKVREEQYA